MKKVTIVIPTYNEEKNIKRLEHQLNKLEGEFDVIFTDGFSTDNTYQLITYPKVRKANFRSMQMNSATVNIETEYIWFLHVDSKFSKKSIKAIENSDAAFGCFKLRFYNSNLLLLLISFLSNFRVKLRHIAFGDQGIFIKRKLFNHILGYSNIPIMEDYDLSMRLKKMRIYPKQLNLKIYTSPRRFYKNGILKTAVRMQILQYMFRHGKDIDHIYARYK